MVKKFIRRTSNRYSKIGLRRKKKQIWRKPTGRDNKMREKRRGYPAVVSLGYRTEKKTRGMVAGKEKVEVKSIKDIEKVKKGQIAVVGRMGKKKKIELAKKAKAKGIEIHNLNIRKLLKPEKMKKTAGSKEDKK